MKYPIELDDIEPLDAGERCDAAYGPYHIGREDEKRAELALFFDARWVPTPGFLSRDLWPILHRYNGRLLAMSEYCSSEHSDNCLRRLLRRHVNRARSFDGVPRAALAVAIVELPKPAVWGAHTALCAYTAYIGYGDVSWPSSFRSIIVANQDVV